MFTILGTKDATVNRADIELLLTELCSSGVDRPYTDKDVKYIMCYTAVAAAAKSLQVISNSLRPHRRQRTGLSRPWDSPGKNTGVGCHFLLQCMKVKSVSEVAQLCPTLSDPMDCSPPGSSVHGIFQVRALEWGAIAFSQCVTLRKD